MRQIVCIWVNCTKSVPCPLRNVLSMWGGTEYINVVQSLFKTQAQLSAPSEFLMWWHSVNTLWYKMSRYVEKRDFLPIFAIIVLLSMSSVKNWQGNEVKRKDNSLTKILGLTF